MCWLKLLFWRYVYEVDVVVCYCGCNDDYCVGWLCEYGVVLLEV